VGYFYLIIKKDNPFFNLSFNFRGIIMDKEHHEFMNNLIENQQYKCTHTFENSITDGVYRCSKCGKEILKGD